MADLKEEKTLYNSGGQNVTTDLSYEGYTEKWRDEFNSTELDRDNWNVELHEPGWVNAELQEYVDSKENIIVKDGKLILKAIKAKNEKGEYVYTSGRVNTQGKQDYKYGIFEAEIKVPEGKGFLPAFWMMPTNEGLYGQWPKCGEIDIMEIMCHDTKTSYGTLHYGVPHKENQGMRTLEDGDFSKEFHKFSCKWEPGKITWYIDGHHLYETSDWYSKTTAGSEMTYPAPFDQPFYMILNLAVGGSWVGYPDESTSFEKAELVINSVRVYQKDDGYDENVKKPVQDNVKEPVKPEVPAGGNYVCNGKFQEGEGRLAFWNVSEGSKVYVTNLLEETGKKGAAKYRVVRKFVAAGNAVLSQTELGLRADTAYALSFKADATKESTVKFSVTGEIVKEVKIPVSDKMTEYTAKFRTSLNPQNQDLKIEITSEGEVYLDEIYIMEDTLIKNGSFNADFTGFETFVDESAAAVFSIDELNNGGKKTPTIEIEGTADKEWKIQLKQTGVQLEKGKCYKLSFKAKSTLDRTIQYALQRDGFVHKNADGGEDWTPYTQETVSVTVDYKTFEKKFKMTFDSDEGTIFNISMGGKNITDKHVISIDDIKLVEIPESEMPKVEAGKIDNDSTPASTITLSDFSIVEVTE